MIGLMLDSFGLRIFRYLYNATSGSTAIGALQSRAAVVSTSAITSGTTTSATKAAAWTASVHNGQLLQVKDNADVAGGAPEGEVSPIISNTAGTVLCDPNYPFTLALAVNDVVDAYALSAIKASAANDLARDVFGISMAAVTTLQYGWWHQQGYCPGCNLKASTGFTAGDPVIADVSTINAFGTTGQRMWIGWSPHTVTSDIVDKVAPMYITLFHPAGPGTTP